MFAQPAKQRGVGVDGSNEAEPLGTAERQFDRERKRTPVLGRSRQLERLLHRVEAAGDDEGIEAASGGRCLCARGFGASSERQPENEKSEPSHHEKRDPGP